MMSRVVRSIVAIVLVGAGWFVGLAQPASAACSRKAPPVTDAKGDANGFVLTDLVLPNEAGLDVLSGAIRWAPKSKLLTFAIRVADLQDGSPAGSTGKYFRFLFTYEAANYQLTASASDVPGGESFNLNIVDGQTTTNLATLKGKFDSVKNTVSIFLPAATFNSANRTFFTGAGRPVPDSLKARSDLSNLSVLGQRQFVVFTPTSDEAVGKCPYAVGQER